MRYDLLPDNTNSESRVAPPMQIGSTPVAIGSNVPPCPIFSPRRRSWNADLSLATTSEDVHPGGLSTLRNPEIECVVPGIINFRVRRCLLAAISEVGDVVNHALTVFERGVENKRDFRRASHLGSNA